MQKRKEKPTIWFSEIKSPPFSNNGRLQAGFLIGRLQRGDKLEMPHSKPMPSIGPRCHELRISDGKLKWRVVYRIDTDAIVIVEVFPKKTQKTPKKVIDDCQDRLNNYDRTVQDYTRDRKRKNGSKKKKQT